MKIWGKRKKNYLVELTPYEMEAITTALFEWQIVENDTSKPVRSFGAVLTRVYKSVNKFDTLKKLNVKDLEGEKNLPKIINIEVSTNKTSKS